MRYRLLTVFVFTFGLVAGAASADSAVIAFTPRERVEFQPANGETITLPFVLKEPGRVRLTIYTGDRDVVRRFGPRQLEPGHYEWRWNGRDETGTIVPDEAYYPVLVCQCESGLVIVDPRKTTGGRALRDLRVEFSLTGVIEYRLAEPARSLVRVGVDGGAMIRSLDSWSPHAAGTVIVRWNGLGPAGKERLLGRPGISVLVRAFTLPDHTIITSGNRDLTYREYRAMRGWQGPGFTLEEAKYKRGGRYIVREAAVPVSMLRMPEPSLEIIDGIDGYSNGLPVIAGEATFRVDMPARDRWLMRQSQYEIGFYLDYEFVSEEETGYVPLSWRWSGHVEPGIHTMVVNVSGLAGKVGVAAQRFVVPQRGKAPE